MKIFILNTGGTLGMVGSPLRAAKTAKQLFRGIPVPENVYLTLEDFPLRQDSTNVTHADRLEMARTIFNRFKDYDAFVILHGTDTLPETCAFLSLALTNLLKPVFVVGSQLPVGVAGSDAALQLANTLLVAKAFFIVGGHGGIFNVCLNHVYAGTRLRKRHHAHYQAFHTPGVPPVGSVAGGLVTSRLPKPTQNQWQFGPPPPRLNENYENAITTLPVSADLPPFILDDVIRTDWIHGIILECKGAGNIPTRPWLDKGYSWVDAIREATKQGIHVAVLSPFEEGNVDLSTYEPGEAALQAGALSLGSLTPAMADVKFRFALQYHRKSPSAIQAYLSANLLGEHLDHYIAWRS